MTSTKKTPLYRLPNIKVNDLSVGIYIMELPKTDILNYLDMYGHFNQAIIHQVLDIIKTRMGHVVNNMLIKTDVYNKYDKLEPVDTILLTFIKHYRGSTQTVAIALNDKIDEDLNDNQKTSKLIKQTFNQCSKVIKMDMCMITTEASIYFGFNKEEEVNTSELEDVIKLLF